MFLDILPTDPGPLRSPAPAAVRLNRFYRHLFLWVLQGWLAMFYLGAAFAKLSQPQDILSYLLQWPALVDPRLVQVIGWAELALAIGLVAPLASWAVFRPVLSLSAAVLLCDALVMGGYHAAAGHWALAAVNAILAGLAAVVLIGRGREARA